MTGVENEVGDYDKETTQLDGKNLGEKSNSEPAVDKQNVGAKILGSFQLIPFPSNQQDVGTPGVRSARLGPRQLRQLGDAVHRQVEPCSGPPEKSLENKPYRRKVAK